jgi:phosphoribosylaminoimidazolecarboxamide formyltransferase/IMP cyclohydrolase
MPMLEILEKYKINIISSGGTFKSIKKMGFKCKEISEFTNFK